MPRLTVQMLIEEDLGYCCPWRFFSLYPDNDLIAARLGVHVRTVQKHRQKALKCGDSPRCLLAKAAASAPKP